jgi:hypothetical protein
MGDLAVVGFHIAQPSAMRCQRWYGAGERCRTRNAPHRDNTLCARSMARRSPALLFPSGKRCLSSLMSNARTSEQYTDNCAELANLLSQFDNFGLQFAMIQIEGFGGHDRTAAVRPPSVRGRSGDTIWNNKLRIARRIDDVSKAMIVGLDGSFLRKPHARILAGTLARYNRSISYRLARRGTLGLVVERSNRKVLHVLACSWVIISVKAYECENHYY